MNRRSASTAASVIVAVALAAAINMLTDYGVFNFTLPIIASAFALFLIAAVLLSLYSNRVSKGAGTRPQPKTLEDRIDELSQTLTVSADLISEINAEIELQTSAAARLRAEADESRRLAELNKEEADAVRSVVEAAVSTAQRRANPLQKRQQWQFFALGLLTSVPLGVAGNFAYAWLTAPPIHP